jgi:transcriptional regulator with XRE-family HTH domain
MSQDVLAGLAGVSQGYVSKIESGAKEIERRSTLVAIAKALQVTVADLTGDDSTDPLLVEARAALPAMEAALIELSLRERRAPARSVSELLAAVDHVAMLRRTGSVAALAPVLPELLLDLAGHDHGALLEMTGVAALTLRHLGHRNMARDAAELMMALAQEREQWAWIAYARHQWIRSMPLETYSLAARHAERIADDIQPHLRDPEVRQAYGQLHLQAALCSAVAVQPDVADAHLAEAEQEAASLGEPNGVGWNNQYFGPTNTRLWRMVIANELAEPGRAVELGQQFMPAEDAPADRRGTYWLEMGRAVAQSGQNDREALTMLARANVRRPRSSGSPVTRERR